MAAGATGGCELELVRAFKKMSPSARGEMVVIVEAEAANFKSAPRRPQLLTRGSQ